MGLPAGEVWLHHGEAGTSSVGTANGYAAYHIRTKGWGEIGYSFVIAGGRVLEGRGAGVVGAHTKGRNDRSHGVCVAGNYVSRQPSPVDLDALVWLLKHGHQQGWWDRPAFTGGHRDAPGASTSCPGDRLQAELPDINRRARASEPEDDMPLNSQDLDMVRQVVRDELSSVQQSRRVRDAAWSPVWSARGGQVRANTALLRSYLASADVLEAVRALTRDVAKIGTAAGVAGLTAEQIVDELAQRLSE